MFPRSRSVVVWTCVGLVAGAAVGITPARATVTRTVRRPAAAVPQAQRRTTTRPRAVPDLSSTSTQMLGWGADGSAQLGDGASSTRRLIPVHVQAPAGVVFTSIALDGTLALAVSSTGTLYTWGHGAFGDGTVGDRITPTPVPLRTGVTAVSVASGGNPAVLGSDGNLYLWGDGTRGCLGRGASDASLVPVSVQLRSPNLPQEHVVSYAVGACHGLALAASGTLYAWGDGSYGDTGVGGDVFSPPPIQFPTPIALPGGARAAKVAAGDFTSFVVDTSGALYSFGQGGLLGDGGRDNQYTPEAVAVPGGRTLRTVTATAGSALAINTTGQVLQWGNFTTPAPVALPGDVTASAVSAGLGFDQALGANGVLYSWGDNSDGNLGNGTTAARAAPAAVGAPGLVTAVSSGPSTSVIATVQVPPAGTGCASTPLGGASPSTTSVQAFVYYTARDGARHPARNLVVQLLDTAIATPTVLATGRSDWTGAASFVVPTKGPGGATRALQIRALAQSPGFTVNPRGSSAPYALDCGPRGADGRTQFATLIATTDSSAGQAFDIADALVSGVVFTRSFNGSSPLPHTIVLRYPGTGPGTLYDGDHTINVLGGNQYDWDVLLHEYGHFVSHELGLEDPTAAVPNHSFGIHETAGVSKAAGVGSAWAEGFGDWFAIAAEQATKAAALALPGGVGDTTYDDTRPGNVLHESLTDAGHRGVGEDDELSIARTLLWYELNPALTPRADPRYLMWSLIGAHPKTFSDAITALDAFNGLYPFAGGSAVSPGLVKLTNDVACELTDEQVGPKLTSPAQLDTVHYDATDPKITWTARANASDSVDVLNSFKVELWSGDWSQLIDTSDPILGTSWQPGTARWKADLYQDRLQDIVNVVVVGTSTTAPQTGPYWGCASTVRIAPVVVVTALRPPLQVIAPACAALGETGYNQFSIYGVWLQRSTNYSLTLSLPGARSVHLPSVTTTAQGEIMTTDGQLPQLPSDQSWNLIATPTSGKSVLTHVDVGTDWCFTWTGPTGFPHFTVAWSGAGAKPGSTVTQEWNGVVEASAVADANGSFSGSYAMTCPAATNTVTTQIPLIHGAESDDATVTCTPPAARGARPRIVTRTVTRDRALRGSP